MTISERIFMLFEKNKDKRQVDLANYLGIKQNTISNWKQNCNNPSAEHLEKIAKFFNVSIDYLCTGKEYANNVSVNQGIFGDKNSNNTVTINGSNAVQLTEFESELIKICAGLDLRHKTALLTYAYELEKEMETK